MTSAEFTGQIASLTEPVRVKRYRAVLGDWFPGGHECEVPQRPDKALETEIVAQRDEIARLKRELAKVHATAGEPLPPTTGGYSRQGDLAVRGILGKLSTGRKGRGD